MPTRRQFLKVGIVSGALLAGAGWFALRRTTGPARGLHWLDPSSAVIVTALVPAVLAGALPQEPVARVAASRDAVEAFDRAVSGLSPDVQKEIAQLFSLLSLPPARVLLTGMTSAWADASPEEVAAFLDRWRSSRLELLRAAYQALTQLLLAAWYGNPASWPAIGYPGPPSLGEPRR
jgi:hypothetical protein